MSAAPRPPLETPRLRPLARFPTVFGWGLRRTVRTRKFAVLAILCLAGGYGLGALLARTRDAAFDLWQFLQFGLLGVASALVALGLVGTGFGEEVQDQTLVWHLVRPVSRTTVFLARFASGAVAGVCCIAGMTLAVVAGSGVAVPAAAVAGTAATAALGTLTTGAVYYALAALFRRGLVAGLVYTFLVEGFFQTLPGTIQRLSLAYHVRSVFRHLTDADFGPLSVAIRREMAAPRTSVMGPRVLKAAAAEDWTSLRSALVICACVVVGALWIGARRVRRRDFALKD